MRVSCWKRHLRLLPRSRCCWILWRSSSCCSGSSSSSDWASVSVWLESSYALCFLFLKSKLSSCPSWKAGISNRGLFGPVDNNSSGVGFADTLLIADLPNRPRLRSQAWNDHSGAWYRGSKTCTVLGFLLGPTAWSCWWEQGSLTTCWKIRLPPHSHLKEYLAVRVACFSSPRYANGPVMNMSSSTCCWFHSAGYHLPLHLAGMYVFPPGILPQPKSFPYGT